MSRYSRQTILPDFGAAGQEKLRKAHLLMIGAGGLGVPALQYLVGAGIGRITLVDQDRVDAGNLHRQTIYGPYLGRPKAEAAAAFARALNPETHVAPVLARFDPANAADLLASADLALDCADSHAVSYLLSDLCWAAGKPLISASALRFAGYAGGFCGGAPSLRAVFPSPAAGDGAVCAQAGVLGPLVGMFGCLQAQMAIAVLLGLAPSPLGRLVSYDARALSFGGFRFDGAPEPESAPHRFISAAEIGPADFAVDLRDEAEAPRPAAVHALRLKVEDFGPDGLLPPPSAPRAVLACRSGLRAWRAADRLREVWSGEIVLVADGGAP